MTKSFLYLLGLAAVLGVGLGAAFIGGVALGKSQENPAADRQSASTFQTAGSPNVGLAGRSQPGGSVQRPTGAGLGGSSDLLAANQSPDQGGDSGVDGVAGRGGLVGTVESIEGDIVTIATPRGPVQATLGQDTVITRVSPATIKDLQAGAQVRLTGQEAEGGGMVATSLTIVPEGFYGALRQGFSGDGGLRRNRSSP